MLLCMILTGMIGLYFLIAFIGFLRWRVVTERKFLDLSLDEMKPLPTGAYHETELEGLPAPVQRYFRMVLKDGQALIRSMRFREKGSIDLSIKGRWHPFTAYQQITTHPAGFVWAGCVKFLPIFCIRSYDRYTGGKGSLEAAFLGLITLSKEYGGREVSEGELFRYLAEAPLYPTALLPQMGVEWESIDEGSARASLQHKDYRVTFVFNFNERGLISSFRTENREHILHGKSIPTPWEGTWTDYANIHGMLIPQAGEVAWNPDGKERQPYRQALLSDFKPVFCKQ